MTYVIQALILTMPLCLFIQPSAQRFFAACVYVTTSHIFYFSLSDLPGEIHYFTSGLINLLIIILTSGIQPVPKMVVRLHAVCVFIIVVNLIGWLLWLKYYPPTFYNMAAILCHLLVFIVLIKRDKSDVGSYSTNSWLSCFRYDNHPLVDYFVRNKGKI